MRCGMNPIRNFLNERSLYPLAFVFAAALIMAGCSGGADRSLGGSAIPDLMEKFIPVDSTLSGKQFYRQMPVVREGVRRESLVLIAPATVRASLLGISGQTAMVGFAAPVFNVGDGMQMDIFLKRPEGRRLVVSRYFDPGRNAEDRNWIMLRIPLNICEEDQLEIELSSGPQEDSTADWLALSSLHLVRESAGN
jgi:hypothetical protein